MSRYRIHQPLRPIALVPAAIVLPILHLLFEPRAERSNSDFKKWMLLPESKDFDGL